MAWFRGVPLPAPEARFLLRARLAAVIGCSFHGTTPETAFSLVRQWRDGTRIREGCDEIAMSYKVTYLPSQKKSLCLFSGVVVLQWLSWAGLCSGTSALPPPPPLFFLFLLLRRWLDPTFASGGAHSSQLENTLCI